MAKRKYKKRKKKSSKKQIPKAYLFSGILFLILIIIVLLNIGKISSISSSLKSSKLKVKEIAEERTVLDAIMHSKRLMGVGDKDFKHYVDENAVYIKLGIDKHDMDLNYANMILTGQIELENGETLSGTEKDNGNKQILRIKDNDDNQLYQVTLYYKKK